MATRICTDSRGGDESVYKENKVVSTEWISEVDRSSNFAGNIEILFEVEVVGSSNSFPMDCEDLEVTIIPPISKVAVLKDDRLRSCSTRILATENDGFFVRPKETIDTNDLACVELGALRKVLNHIVKFDSKSSSLTSSCCQEILTTLECLVNANNKNLEDLVSRDVSLNKCERCGVISYSRSLNVPGKKLGCDVERRRDYWRMYRERKTRGLKENWEKRREYVCTDFLKKNTCIVEAVQNDKMMIAERDGDVKRNESRDLKRHETIDDKEEIIRNISYLNSKSQIDDLMTQALRSSQKQDRQSCLFIPADDTIVDTVEYLARGRFDTVDKKGLMSQLKRPCMPSETSHLNKQRTLVLNNNSVGSRTGLGFWLFDGRKESPEDNNKSFKRRENDLMKPSRDKNMQNRVPVESKSIVRSANDSLENCTAVSSDLARFESDTTISSSSAENMIREWVKTEGFKNDGNNETRGGSRLFTTSGEAVRRMRARIAETVDRYMNYNDSHRPPKGKTLVKYHTVTNILNEILEKSTLLNLPIKSTDKPTETFPLYQKTLKSHEKIDWEGFRELIQSFHPGRKQLYRNVCKIMSEETGVTEIQVEFTPASSKPGRTILEIQDNKTILEIDMLFKDVETFLGNHSVNSVRT